MGQRWKRFRSRLDDYKLRKKLKFLYIYCVLLPLIITDSVIIYIFIASENANVQRGMENIASAVKYNFFYDVEEAAGATKKIYMNKYVNQFLDKQFETQLDYFLSYQAFMKDSLFESSIGSTASKITMYADNPTIVSGGEFKRLAPVKDQQWYQYLISSNQDGVLYIYYDSSSIPTVDAKKRITFLRKLNFYQRDGFEKIVKMDLDYSSMVQSFAKMNYDAPVYVCWNNKIILSNQGHSGLWDDFDTFDLQNQVGYETTFASYGMDLQIYVLKPKTVILSQIINNIPLIALLIMINTVLPWLFMKMISQSFTERLKELSEAFKRVDDEKLMEIKNVRGEDEIGMVMRNYNRMVTTINDLIQTVYIDRLREQEMDIERQNAELLALHSQINPHFLFNALESIRMHSLLKNEKETACMVEQLARMERQNFDWGTDFITVKEEISFVEAYLQLQKYRFGDRLSYKLDIMEECLDYRIPKLTIVTFVENACVHGIESKSTEGWIFVRIYLKDEMFYLEIEDTGEGIQESFLEELKYKMEHASIDKLKDKKGVGILNACLRLKMATEDKVSFDLESEAGLSTMITIKIPVSYLSK
ncbi:sensor histidine kinase [Lacrimispora sp.]|uniref:sensor histidine kinase n=1 Tax=Lacrimispora sp. TaxID=2719234 RepID=UPI0028AADC01|nr:histidine kinase [Lacrimispora sp.]